MTTLTLEQKKEQVKFFTCEFCKNFTKYIYKGNALHYCEKSPNNLAFNGVNNKRKVSWDFSASNCLDEFERNDEKFKPSFSVQQIIDKRPEIVELYKLY